MLAPTARTGGRQLALASLWLLTAVFGTADVGHAELFAEQLTVTNLAARRLGGPDAIAGLGDWVLGNGVLCAAISAPNHESTLSDRGGVLIDLGHCGRDDDQWGVLQPMLNLSRADGLAVDTVRGEVEERVARIVTHGETKGLRVTTRYELGRAEASRLRIETVVERVGTGEALFLFGDVALHGHRQLTPFTLAEGRPKHNVGFDHPAVDIDSPFAMVDAMVRADTQVLVGGSQLEPGIAYGWRIVEARVERRDGSSEALVHLALNGEHFSILGVYCDTLFFGGTGEPGLLELAQTLLMDLELGERIVYLREFVVGRRADVASVTDQFWSDGPRVVGRVEDPDARLHVFDANDHPLTFVRPDPNGEFSFRVPRIPTDSEYRIRVRARNEIRAERSIRFGDDQQKIELGLLRTGPAASLALPHGERMRLVFVGIPPTKTPILGGDGLEFFVGGERVPSSSESSDLSLAGVPSDPRVQRLPPGRYRVLATRGPEWSVSETEIELRPGQQKRLELEPPVRLIEPSGFISADLHVHAAPSDDSALPLRMRIASFAAQGADLIVATEHDNVFDYGPTIRAMGLGESIASIVGTEITSTVMGDLTPYTSGHTNAFPLVLHEAEYRHGAPFAENRRLRHVIAAVRALPGRPIVQLNHPRESGLSRGLSSYFSHLAVSEEPYDPTLPLGASANAPLVERAADSGLRDLDFDAVELLNGSSMESYRLTRADWFSLLLQGEVRTGTANSDSHGASTLVALPRNYVAYRGPRGQQLDTAKFMQAIRAGQVYGSTGPLLEVELDEVEPGGLFSGNQAELRVKVTSASWVPVEEIRVYVDGDLRHRAPVPEGGRLRIALGFARDAFVTVEVEGTADPDSIYGLLAPGFTPFAFSNPIFVDADGQPGWTAPGLPETLPPTIRTPLEAP